MSISFGIFLILNPNVLMSLIPFCSGVVIFIDAIYQVRNSLTLKHLDHPRWWINLAIGLFFVAFAIFIMVKASNISHLIIRFIGAILIINAVMDFYTYFMIKKYSKKTENSLKVIDVKINE